MTYRYDDLVTPAGSVSRFTPPSRPALDRQHRRSMVLADLGPSPLMVMTVREVFPRMRTSAERSALLESLAIDPVGALQRVLTTYRLGPALRTLINRAIAAQRAIERAHGLEPL